MYDGIWLTSGFRKQSVNLEIWSVGPQTAEMIGLPGMSGLWILGNMWKHGVLGCLGIKACTS